MRLVSASSLAIAAGAVFALCPAPAHAQQALMSKVYACADIADAGQRHACFDALTPDLKAAQAVEAGAAPLATLAPSSDSALTAPVTTKKQKQAKREKEKEAGLDRVSLPVRSIETRDGYMIVTLQNGQVWKQTDTIGIHNLGDPPWTAEIRKAALGSFMLKIGRSAAMHVQRLN